jgi:GAF domain-containing protein
MKSCSFIRHELLPDTKSELAMPVKIGDQLLGILDIQQAPPGIFTDRDLQLVSAVADQLAMPSKKRIYMKICKHPYNMKKKCALN